MKKFLALVLAVLMIASTVVSVAAFDDVAEDSVYADAINDLQEYGIVAGTTETTFAPDELVTRWQMALFMARAKSGITDDAEWAEGAALFTDCTQYLGAIQYCYTQGIIKGVTATEFAPNANITLRDGVIMAVRALGYENAVANEDGTNVTGAAYWLPYYQKADELGMLTNLDKTAVTKEMTRAETAQLIYNMLNTKVYNDNDNGYKYTLAEVVFEGKQIVDIDNVTGAWISQTPLQSIGVDTIDADEEIVVLTVLDKENEYPEIEVPFADLEAAGVDVENIEEYFGAYIELINCRVDRTLRDEDITGGNAYRVVDNYVYQEYEYLSGVNKDNMEVATDAVVTYHNSHDRIRIGNKTHYYETDAEGVKTSGTNKIALYTATDVDDGWEKISAKKSDIDNDNKVGENAAEVLSINEQLKDKFYDVTFIDTDVDGYYEVGLVTFYEIEEYKSSRSTGKEACGIMEGIKNVEYSEELSTGDVFVYTFNPFTNTVDVKEVLAITEGNITGYSEEVDEIDHENLGEIKVTTGYVTIDGVDYVIPSEAPINFFGTDSAVNSKLNNFIDDDTIMNETNLVNVTAGILRTTASNYVGDEVEYYLYNNLILAFGEKVKEGAESYLVVDEFTDFELYDHVVLDAYIDGVEETIKVKKIYTMNGNNKERKYNFADLGYGKLSAALTDIFGLYTYSIDNDGFYVLTEVVTLANGGTVDASHEYAIDLAPYLNSNGVIQFKDYVAEKKTNSTQDTKIRVSSATTIYIVNMDRNTYGVEVVKPASHFSIDLGTTGAMLITDRVGYGNTDDVNTAIGTGKEIKYGKSSVLYIVTDAEYVDHSNYKFVYVDTAISSRSVGDMDSFGLETGVEEEMYFKYTADGEAYTVGTFDEIAEIYVQKDSTAAAKALAGNNALKAGVYLLNEENIISDYMAADAIQVGENELTAKKDVELPFYMVELKAGDINLYGYDYITLADLALSSRNNVQTIKVRFFERNAGVIEYVDKKNDALKEYLCEEYPNGTDSLEIKMILVPNTPTGFDDQLSFTSNTLCAIAYETPDPEVATVVEYTITFELNAPADITNIASTFTTAGITEATAETVDGEFTVADIQATSDNYDFVGWATTADATTADAVAGDVLEPSDDVTYYGVWTLKTAE